MARTSETSPVCLVDLVCFVYLVDLVHLVSFVQPKNQTDQTNQINQITVFFRWRTVSASCWWGEPTRDRALCQDGQGREARANCVDEPRCSDVRWTSVICEYVGTNVALY